jgi:hypothetical protein
MKAQLEWADVSNQATIAPIDKRDEEAIEEAAEEFKAECRAALRRSNFFGAVRVEAYLAGSKLTGFDSHRLKKRKF